MSIQLTAMELKELQPRITVMGVGGAGGNAVNNMIAANLEGVAFVVANTDAQALAHARTETRIQLGVQSTQGLGAGSRPEVGRAAAEEAIDLIEQHLDGCHMLFLAAGMGGGTGTGATPVIARLAREKGILTVGVVTKPFHFEGRKRMAIAEAGLEELERVVDTLIVIPNQNLFRIATEKTTFQDAFAMADEVLCSGVRSITDLMVMPGLINLDFADVKAVMSEMGKAMMGTGEAEGERRAIEAAEAAIANPLLDDVSLKGARGVIINITGGMDMTLFEVDEAANHIRDQVDPEANIIFGSAFNENLNGVIRVSVVATGIDGEAAAAAPEESGQGAAVVRFPAREQRDPETGAQEAADASANASADGVGTASPGDGRASSGEGASEDAAAARMRGAEEAVGGEIADTAVDAEATAGVADAAFIAPEPELPEDYEEPVGRADPFAEAAYANVRPASNDVFAGPDDASGAQEGRRGPSLFQRMTGLGRRRQGRRARAVEKIAGAPAVSDGKSAASAEGTTGAARVGALQPEDRVVPARPATSEEQLEIPAFLRRQMN